MTRLCWGGVSFDIEGAADTIVGFLMDGGLESEGGSERPAILVRVSHTEGIDRVHESMVAGARLQARVCGSGYEKTLHIDRSALIWRYGPERCVIRFTPADRKLDVFAESAEALRSPRFLNVALMEALQWTMMMEGIPFAHAAGIIANDKGILVAGPSGSGKSIVSLTLALSGFQLATDDSVGLLRSEQGPRMLFSPEWLGLVEGADKLFPGISDAILRAASPILAFHPKIKVPRRSVGIPLGSDSVPVRHVVFLRKIAGSAPFFSRLSAREGTMRMLENLVLFDAEGFPDVSRSHAETIFDLAGHALFHQLTYSPAALAEIPPLFRDLISDESSVDV